MIEPMYSGLEPYECGVILDKDPRPDPRSHKKLPVDLSSAYPKALMWNEGDIIATFEHQQAWMLTPVTYHHRVFSTDEKVSISFWLENFKHHMRAESVGINAMVAAGRFWFVEIDASGRWNEIQEWLRKNVRKKHVTWFWW